ncbi:mitochondrial peptide methionine sulfoxide reductase isoform X6 [Podarcis raffonei]|uniref:mitochondrial peptide methionine sulfoxide reductase isoform X6 n=1 Tax=Podarcis raffonei TaxID=65483 RepID=UPI0023296845|nr:mitochondrial peptide methionine sulfoxide reductase isoform X6 [Podarcis raffonei]
MRAPPDGRRLSVPFAPVYGVGGGAMSSVGLRRLFLAFAAMGEAASSALKAAGEREVLPGRSRSLVRLLDKHHVNGNSMVEPFPEGTQMAIFGRTGHTEAVRVVFQPETISFEKLLKVFWENHDPTQGMRQGNDFGTQYRSAIYTFSPEQMEAALRSKEDYQKVLTENGFGTITTEIREAPEFYYAEEYHQQYLSKHPNGYCGLGGTGVSCPIGV